MATIANCTSPFELADVDTVSTPITAAFPVPATAWGFCVEVPDSWFMDDRVSGYTMSAMSTEGDYLEPTTGQIWPR